MHYFPLRKNPSTIIRLFLCTAVLLSCLLSPSLFPAKDIYTDSHSVSLQGDLPEGFSYPDFIHLGTAGEQHPLLFSAFHGLKRIPMRLPVPHIWISYMVFLFIGLAGPKRRRICGRNKDGCSRDHIIRYIHNQNGETYHLSCF